MTVPDGVLAVLAMLAGLLRDLTQLAVSPSGLTALALGRAVLAGAMLRGGAGPAHLGRQPVPDDRRAPDDPPRLGAAGEVLACGVLAPARSRRGGPAQAQSTIGGPGGRPFPVTTPRTSRPLPALIPS